MTTSPPCLSSACLHSRGIRMLAVINQFSVVAILVGMYMSLEADRPKSCSFPSLIIILIYILIYSPHISISITCTHRPRQQIHSRRDPKAAVVRDAGQSRDDFDRRSAGAHEFGADADDQLAAAHQCRAVRGSGGRVGRRRRIRLPKGLCSK